MWRLLGGMGGTQWVVDGWFVGWFVGGWKWVGVLVGAWVRGCGRWGRWHQLGGWLSLGPRRASHPEGSGQAADRQAGRQADRQANRFE